MGDRLSKSISPTRFSVRPLRPIGFYSPRCAFQHWQARLTPPSVFRTVFPKYFLYCLFFPHAFCLLDLWRLVVKAVERMWTDTGLTITIFYKVRRQRVCTLDMRTRQRLHSPPNYKWVSFRVQNGRYTSLTP